MVDEGKELIRKRQKLIRIADKSADGWKVVDEYVSDEIPSGSEDEKRLKKANEAASRKGDSLHKVVAGQTKNSKELRLRRISSFSR